MDVLDEGVTHGILVAVGLHVPLPLGVQLPLGVPVGAIV